MANADDTTILKEMMKLSVELDSMEGVNYKHDGYQATIAAAALALDHTFTLLTLPTSGGKTFVIGLLFYFSKYIDNKSVIVVTPNDDLRTQMIN